MSDDVVLVDEQNTPIVEKPKKGRVRTLFNALVKAAPSLAIGAGTVMAAKAVTGLALITAPVWASLAAATVIVAAATVSLEHVRAVNAERKAAKDAGSELTPLSKGGWTGYFNAGKFVKTASNKKTLVKASFNAAATLVGGLAVIAFDAFDLGEKVASLFGIGDAQGASPNAVMPALSNGSIEPLEHPPVLSAPVVETTVVEPTALEKTANMFIDIETESALAQATLDAAMNGDMQSTKDTAYFLFNGFEGLPQDRELAAELYTVANNAGNIQAQTDYAYIQYHGLVKDVIPQDQSAALKTINEIGRSWVGGEALLDKAATAPKPLKL